MSKSSARADEKRKRLRAIGINPYKGNRKLTHDQKSYIARLWRKFGELASDEKNSVVTLRSKSKDFVRAARESGYLTYRNKVVVHKEGAKRVRNVRGVIRFDYANGKTKDALVTRRKNWQRQLDEVRKKKLGPREYVTGKFFDHSPWHQVFSSVDALERYIVDFTPNDVAANKDKLLSHLSIVRFEANADHTSLTQIAITKPLRKGKTKRATKAKIRTKR